MTAEPPKPIIIWDLSFFARVQICPPQFGGIIFFTINQRLMETETCFPETRFRFQGLIFFARNIDGNGNMFPGNTFPFPSVIICLINLLSIYGACSYLGSNGTINYSVGASSMLMLASDNLSDTLPRLSPPL